MTRRHTFETLPSTLAFTFLLLFCAWLSWPALTGPFLFDDFPNLKHLADLKGDLGWRSLAEYVRQYGGAPGRPLSMLSFVINDDAWPSSPRAFKYTNLMLHLLIGTLVFGLARSLAKLRLDGNSAHLAALLTMAAWLLNPLQLSTSMLVVQRMTQLSMLFALAGVWGYVVLARRSVPMSTAFMAIIALGTGTVVAVLCKETGALAPLLAVVINETLLRDRMRELPRRSRQILRWGTILPVLAMFAVIGSRWESAIDFSNRSFTMGERLLTQARVLLNYLYHILVPNLRGGGIYHDDFIVSRGLLEPWTTLPAIVVIAALGISALALIRRWPLFSFATLWFFSGHLLESTIFPLEMYFEHRNYLPMFGPLFALAICVAGSRREWRRALLTLAVAWIAFAAWLTSVQAPIWGDIRKLTGVWAIEHPNSARAMAQRAKYLSSLGLNRQAAGILLDAYRRGVRGGSFPLQVVNVACSSGNVDLSDEAWPLAIHELKSGEYNRALLETMSRLRRMVESERCPATLTADRWLDLTHMLLANPHYAEGGVRNYVYVERAYLFRHRRDLDATMREFQAAWDARPSSKLAQLIAATLASAGLYAEGEKWADRAISYRPSGFQGWLSNDERVSHQLKAALRKARIEQSRTEAK